MAAAGMARQQKNPGAVVACVHQLDWTTGLETNSTSGHWVHRSRLWQNGTYGAKLGDKDNIPIPSPKLIQILRSKTKLTDEEIIGLLEAECW